MIPKSLRDQVGLGPGEVEIGVDGAGLRVEALSGDGIVTRAGRQVIPASGAVVDDDVVRQLRDAGQR